MTPHATDAPPPATNDDYLAMMREHHEAFAGRDFPPHGSDELRGMAKVFVRETRRNECSLLDLSDGLDALREAEATEPTVGENHFRIWASLSVAAKDERDRKRREHREAKARAAKVEAEHRRRVEQGPSDEALAFAELTDKQRERWIDEAVKRSPKSFTRESRFVTVLAAKLHYEAATTTGIAEEDDDESSHRPEEDERRIPRGEPPFVRPTLFTA